MKKRFLFVGVIILAIIGIIAFFDLAETKAKKVETVRVERGDIVDYIKATGRVEAVEDEVIRARETIRIDKILVEEGEMVKAGQELLRYDLSERKDDVQRAKLKLEQAEIAIGDAMSRLEASERTYADPSELEINLRSKESDYRQSVIEKETAERELKVCSELYKVGAESLLNLKAEEDRLKKAEVRLMLARIELEEAKEHFSKREKTKINRISLRTAYERALRRKALAEAELELAVSRLERLKVTSSLSGSVIKTDIKEGMFVAPGEKLMTIVDLKGLQVKAEVDEVDAGRIKKGQEAVITFDAFPGKEFYAHVDSVALQALIKDERTIVETVLLLDETTDLLKIANQVDVKIIVEKKKNVHLLSLSVVHGSGSPYVWLQKDGEARKVEVETGLMDLDAIEITGGLNEGDEVILDFSAGLRNAQ